MLIPKYKNLSRRQLLTMISGASAVPALWPFMPRVEAAEGDAANAVRRYSYWLETVMPHRDQVKLLYSEAPSTMPLVFRSSYGALNEMKDKIVYPRNVSRRGGNGAGGPHPVGVCRIVGWDNEKGKDRGFYGPDTTSMCYELGQRTKQHTMVSDIRCGIKNSGKDKEYDTSCTVNKGVPQGRYQDPVKLYDNLFKGLPEGGTGGGGGSTQPSQALLNKQSVLTAVKDSLNKMKNRVSHFDKQRIEAHETAISDVEKSIADNMTPVAPPSGCSTMGLTAQTGNEPVVYKSYSDLMAIAFSCDVTRVAGSHYGNSANGIRYAHLSSYKGGGAGFHSSTHGKHSGNAYIMDVLKFRAEQVNYYLKKLDSIVEPDGSTVLDNTFFWWQTDVSRSHQADKDCHMILAGATRGPNRLKMHGNFVKVAESTRSNDMLVSAAHFMGFDDIKKWGNPNYCNGPLPGEIFGS